MNTASFGRSLLENPFTFMAVEPRKILKSEVFMKTGLTKKQKTTAIYFDEDSPIIEVITYNTDLKNRLSSFASQHPKECKLIDDDEQGCKTFEVKKGWF